MPTEEQTSWNTAQNFSSSWKRIGQLLTVPNRTISKLGFLLWKGGSPGGNITFTIRRVSDDSIIATKVWGNASTLDGTPTYREVTFDTPVLVNEEVRIMAEHADSNVPNIVYLSANNISVKPDEQFTLWNGSYTTNTWDAYYIYTYEGPSGMKGLSVPNMATMITKV